MANAGRLAMIVAVLLLAGGCSDSKFVPVPGDTNSEQHLKQNCANPNWKEQNLGLWYSLCRKPATL